MLLTGGHIITAFDLCNKKSTDKEIRTLLESVGLIDNTTSVTEFLKKLVIICSSNKVLFNEKVNQIISIYNGQAHLENTNIIENKQIINNNQCA